MSSIFISFFFFYSWWFLYKKMEKVKIVHVKVNKWILYVYVCDFILYNYVISEHINGLDTRFTFL